MKTNLENNVYSKLSACATSVEQYFIWDINEGILSKDEVSYEFIDSMKEDDIELTFFEEDTRYISSIKDENGNRIEDTKADSEIWETIKNGNDYRTDEANICGTDYYIYYKPVKSEAGEVIGMACAGENKGTVKAAEKSLTRSMYAIDSILLIIFGIILYRLAILIKKPIENITKSIDTLANGDLIEEVNVKSILAEITTLIGAAKTLQDKVGNVVTKVSGNANTMDNTVEDLNNLSNSSNAGAQEISQTMDELAKTSASLAENVQKVNSKVKDMGNEITEIKAKADNLNKNAEQMRSANENAALSMETVLDSSHKSVETVDHISEQIQSTNDAIAEITNAVSLILGITNQTKLLSLNASIEAARAGEQGRGFAVVASEIQKLSEQSEESAETIRSIADNILGKSKETVDLAKDIKDIIEQEQKNISETQKNFDALSKSIEKSIEAAEVINNKTVSLDGLKDSIISNVNDLSAISEENAASNEEVTASVENIAKSIENMTNETSNIKSMSAELEELMKYFTV